MHLLSSASIGPLREPRLRIAFAIIIRRCCASASEGEEGGEGGRSVLYEISPAFNLGRGYVVISVQDTATLWKPEPLTWRERAITRLAGHAPWCVYWKNSDAISDRWQRRFATRVVESLTRAKLVTKRSSSPSHPRSVIYRSLYIRINASPVYNNKSCVFDSIVGSDRKRKKSDFPI